MIASSVACRAASTRRCRRAGARSDRRKADVHFCEHGAASLSRIRGYGRRLQDNLHLNVDGVDASAEFHAALKGIADPEQKRKIIAGSSSTFFQAEAEKIGDVKWLVQGTLYPDVIESVSLRGASVTIKTHHNVGGLPEKMHLRLIEPLRELFKDEVAISGATSHSGDDPRASSISRAWPRGPEYSGRYNRKVALLQKAD